MHRNGIVARRLSSAFLEHTTRTQYREIILFRVNDRLRKRFASKRRKAFAAFLATVVAFAGAYTSYAKVFARFLRVRLSFLL